MLEVDTIEPVIDPRSTTELFEAGLSQQEEQRRTAIGALHWRGTWDVLEGAIELSVSKSPAKRVLAADVLGQLGIPERTFPDQCLKSLKAMLKDKNICVLESVIVALHHVDQARCTELVLPFVNHKNANVRDSVAFNLAGNQKPEAIDALIALSADPDSGVRNWATFGLGIQCEKNSPEIREALADRLNDEDEEVRFEAVCGLAQKRDNRSLPYLIPMLMEMPEDGFAREAAANLLGLEDYAETSTIKLIQSLSRLKKFRGR